MGGVGGRADSAFSTCAHSAKVSTTGFVNVGRIGAGTLKGFSSGGGITRRGVTAGLGMGGVA